MNTALDGSYDRLAEKALRICALLGSFDNNNRMEMQHWAKAQQIAEIFRHNLHEMYSQVNHALEEPAENRLERDLIGFLRSHPNQWFGVPDLQQKVWRFKNEKADTLHNILFRLAKDEVIESNKIGKAGRKQVYKAGGAE